MNTLVLKLLLTPALIGAASLAGRRWGPAVSGWLVGLPWTSGPIMFFLALAQGAAFAGTAAEGTLAGAISQAVFCVAYVALTARFGWPAAVAGASLAFLAVTAGLQTVSLSLGVTFLSVLAVLVVALRLIRAPSQAAPAASPAYPAWDLPARMVAATSVVLLLTGLAPALGARLTGLLAPFPIYAATLAVFAQRRQGPAAAAGVLRGLLLGLFAYAGFYLALAALLLPAGLAPAFAVAVVVAVLVQFLSGRRLSGRR